MTTTSWLDLVPAVPAVGLVFKSWFKSRDALITSLEPLFSDLQEKGQFMRFQDHGPLGLSVETSGGFALQFDLMNVVVLRPGTDERVRYSEALDQVVSLLGDVCRHLITGQRDLVRVGVIAEGEIEKDAVPPGVRAWLDRMSAPFGEFVGATCRLTTKVGAGEGTQDRCHHRIKSPAGDERVTELRLDWQRVFDPMVPLRGRDVVKRVEEHVADALAYFERFAVAKDRSGP